jgi:tRNA nucleotidyltransferase (CCA-adding enzyme)
MKIYLVGGAVRDQLLGLPIKERDWVVTGATVQDMLNQGFRQVGKDFPVFLHPKTQEEYALARIERKVGRGYTGFTFDTSPSVSLEEDLLRRDLTINAIAQTLDGEVIDPFHGQEDLAKKILRHVSPAFTEDPVRILRVGRFAARFGFPVASETTDLMKQMVAAGEVDALVPERVWKELERALTEKYPAKFFETLAACGALTVLFPAVNLDSAGIKALTHVMHIPSSSQVRFAILLHDCSAEEIKALCDHYRVPNQHRELALLVMNYLSQYQTAKELSAEALLDLLIHTDAFRRHARFNEFLQACEACSTHSTSLWLYDVFHVAADTPITDLPAELKGKQIAEKVKSLRLNSIQQFLTSGDMPSTFTP